MSKPGQGAQAKKPVPVSTAFSMDDAAEGDADAATNETTTAEDPKGLSRCWKTTECTTWLTVSRLL